MITTLKRKLLEKQRVQNRFASYEKYIGHFFLQCQCYCQFWKSFNLVYIWIFHWTVCGFCHSALQPFKCVCSMDTRVYTKLTFHLHHAWHSCSIFTGLWCGCSFIKLAFYLHHTPHLGFGYSWHNGTNNTRTRPYYGHTSSPRIPGLYHIQDIDRIKIVDDHTV